MRTLLHEKDFRGFVPDFLYGYVTGYYKQFSEYPVSCKGASGRGVDSTKRKTN